jgi:hypothetical protein
VLERLDFLERALAQRHLPPLPAQHHGPEAASAPMEGPSTRIPTPI